jgi:hypothetical protein
MEPWLDMQDSLRRNPLSYRYLDAAQLVKHAFGLSAEAKRVNRSPVLLHLYAGPARVPASACSEHRAEIESFSTAARGARIRFAATSWADWLDRFAVPTAPPAGRAHAEALRLKFQP